MLALTITAALIMTAYIMLQMNNYYNIIESELVAATKNIQENFKREIDKLDKFYFTRIKCNLSSDDVFQAIHDNDTKKLYQIVSHRFKTLTEENPRLKVMHFQTKDNVSILRMHMPSKHGDDLTNKRPIIRDTNKFLRNNSGLEVGVYGIFYRVTSPIIHPQLGHIGSVEFGIDMKYFADLFQAYYAEKKFAYIVRPETMNIFKNKHHLEKLKGYFMISDYNSFFKDIEFKLDFNKQYNKIKHDGKFYLISSKVEINNYKGEPVARLLAATDITDQITRIRKEAAVTACFGALILISILIASNYGFEYYIRKLGTAGKELEEAHNQLQESHKIIDKFVIMSETDLDGIITSASSRFSDVSGYDKDELVGSNHNIIRHPEMPDSLFKELWSKIKEGKTWSGQFKNKKKDGGFYWVDAHITPKFDVDNNITGYTAIRYDITDKKRVEEISIKDELTGLHNRRHFNHIITDEFRRNKRLQVKMSLLIFDIDYFKKYNDTYGHQMGDKALQQIGVTIKESLHRAGDFAFRIGGEEFCIIFSGLDEKEAFSFADKIRLIIESLSIVHEKNDVSDYVTVSMGLFTAVPSDDLNEDDYYKEADAALYKAKESGRNRVISANNI